VSRGAVDKGKRARLHRLFFQFGNSLRNSGFPGQSQFDELFGMLFDHHTPAVGSAAPLDVPAIANGFIIVIVVGQIA